MKKKSNILIVDDKVDVRETVKNILQGSEFSFLEADRGESALNLIRSKKVDLIILDIRLPDIDGIKTFKKAKNIKPDLPPVIVLTGYNDIEPAVEAGKLGVFDYLLKDPISYEQLRDAVIKATTWVNKPNSNIVKRCFKFGISGCHYKIPIQNDLVFVGMPFSLSDIYKHGIRPTVEALGMNCWQAYEKKSFIDIACKICWHLQASRIAVMDISDLRPNVLFEIGLAYGYGKKVILLKNIKTTMPADLAGIEHIEYSTLKSLKKDLKGYLKEILFNDRK